MKPRQGAEARADQAATLAKSTRAREATPELLYGQAPPHPTAKSTSAKTESKPDFAGTELEALRLEKETRRKLEPKSSRPSPASSAEPQADQDDGLTSKKKGSKFRAEGRDGSPELLSSKVGEALLPPRPEDRSKTISAKDEVSDAKRIEGERGKSTSKDDPSLAARIQVNDLRKSQAKKEAVKEIEAGEGLGGKKGEETAKVREISLDLSKASAAPPSDKPIDAKPIDTGPKASDFATVLAERLRDSGNTEIVQSARIILKDGDAGTIRMRLNPPELGNVKIELNLADNSISGKIVVESDEAKSAFEKGLAELQDAFRSGGFESAKLEVSVGSGDAGRGGARDRGEDGPSPFWSERRRGLAFDPQAPTMPSPVRRSERAVDIVV